MAFESVSIDGKNGKQYCIKCRALWDLDLARVIWKLKFLTQVFSSLNVDDCVTDKEELWGLMVILDDIASGLRLEPEPEEN